MWNQIEEFIYKELPLDGEWKDDSNAQPFVAMGSILMDCESDFNIEEIKERLQNLYYGVAAEFGSKKN